MPSFVRRRFNDYPAREYTTGETPAWKCHTSKKMDEDIVCPIWKHIDKRTKNRYFGRQDYIVCTYDPCNRRIYQANTGDTIVYGWNHSGIELPENPANALPEFALQSGNKQPF